LHYIVSYDACCVPTFADRGWGGQGGSGGTSGGQSCNIYTPTCVIATAPGAGGSYGAGGGYASAIGTSQGGAVRIVWPGATRTFPTTCVSYP
jgi:hypothetical protein